MGAILSCSHSNLDVYNIDHENYKSSDGVWMIRPASATCNDCSKNMRVIKKICVDHGIEQPWEEIDPLVCQHDHMRIKNKAKDSINNRYTGRLECVFCNIESPVFYTFIMKKDNNGKLTEVLTSDWTSDKKQMLLESERKRNGVKH